MRARSVSGQVALVTFLALAIYLQSGIGRHGIAWASSADPMVVFNVRSHKFHHPDCDSAKACTANCVTISRSEAIRRGGVPCKHCGGGMRIAPTQDQPDSVPSVLSAPQVTISFGN
jgi:hypothetical protein